VESLDTVIVVMLKNKETGLFEKELDMYKINEFDSYITNIFAQNEDDKIFIYFKITIDKEALDWEFFAIFDYYDTDIFGEHIQVMEDEDCYNPTWILKFEYNSNTKIMEDKIKNILEIHINELKEVYKSIEDKSEEYK
jgi:hypothetical protein